MSTKGTVVAAMVAGLFASAPLLASAADKPAAGGDVKCSGVNECKGKGACGGADHGCAGKNECKGKGWIKISDKDCKAKKGTVVK
jgi:hypothetical protein